MLPRNMLLKLGTHRSMQAGARSSWIARQLESHSPDLKVELIRIENHFPGEIDEALISGRIDLIAHSMTELELERPREIRLAAIPRRDDPRDAILFRPREFARHRDDKVLRIGGWGPHRRENIPLFLSRALPGQMEVQWQEQDDDIFTSLTNRRLGAVVLAVADLIRLWREPPLRAELQPLLRGLRWMVLPLSQCPTAPAQGALAVECRNSDTVALRRIRKIHDAETERLVSMERELLQHWGGSSHPLFGATSVATKELGDLLYIHGKRPDGTACGTKVGEVWSRTPPLPSGAVRSCDRQQLQSLLVEQPLEVATPPTAPEAVYVTDPRAIPKNWLPLLAGTRIWTANTETWFGLAAQGLWVEGCADNLGFDAILPALEEEVLDLPPPSCWTVLTHAASKQHWKPGRVLATCRVERATVACASVQQNLQMATHYFWESSSLFELFKDWLPGTALTQAHHACLPNETARNIRHAVANVDVFTSADEWKRWLNLPSCN